MASRPSPFTMMRDALAAGQIDTEGLQTAVPPPLREQLAGWRETTAETAGLPDGALAACLIGYAQLHGAITLELAGRIPPQIQPAALSDLQMALPGDPAGTLGCRFSPFRRHRMRNGAGKPVTEPRRSLPLGAVAVLGMCVVPDRSCTQCPEVVVKPELRQYDGGPWPWQASTRLVTPCPEALSSGRAARCSARWCRNRGRNAGLPDPGPVRSPRR